MNATKEQAERVTGAVELLAEVASVTRHSATNHIKHDLHHRSACEFQVEIKGLSAGLNNIARAIALAGQRIGDGSDTIAHQLKMLGNADASTSMGALEALGAVHKDGLGEIASAIRDGLTDIATAQYEKADAA